jgi:hypothetical protein
MSSPPASLYGRKALPAYRDWEIMPIYQCIFPVTGQSEGELLISLWESPPENVMEAGLIFPALGQEERWFEENRARLTELGIAKE